MAKNKQDDDNTLIEYNYLCFTERQQQTLNRAIEQDTYKDSASMDKILKKLKDKTQEEIDFYIEIRVNQNKGDQTNQQKQEQDHQWTKLEEQVLMKLWCLYQNDVDTITYFFFNIPKKQIQNKLLQIQKKRKDIIKEKPDMDFYLNELSLILFRAQQQAERDGITLNDLMVKSPEEQN